MYATYRTFSSFKRHGSLSDLDLCLSSSRPRNMHIAQCTGRLQWCYPISSSLRPNKDRNALSSILANSIRLKGPLPPKAPCRGGPPTLKNPLRLLPTFQTVTAPSSNETVRSRLPSGENVTEETGARWGSSTYSREAVFNSYLLISFVIARDSEAHMMTAPS